MLYFRQLLAKLKTIFVGYTTPPTVGVDIGSASVKMVELVPDSLKIRKYNIRYLAKNLVSNGVINDIEQVADVIRNQWLLFNPRYRDVAIAIPYNSVIMREISAPQFKTSFELDEYVLSQLVRELDNEDIDFDYNIIRQDSESKLLNVVVAKKEKIEEYQAIIQMTGIQVAAIDVEPFALSHLFKLLLELKNKREQCLVIDIGLSRVRAYLFENCANIYYSEISVNYLSFIEDLIINYSADILLKDISDLSGYVINLINHANIQPSQLVAEIVNDISKLLQFVRSNLLVDKKINLNPKGEIYLMGGECFIAGFN